MSVQRMSVSMASGSSAAQRRKKYVSPYISNLDLLIRHPAVWQGIVHFQAVVRGVLCRKKLLAMMLSGHYSLNAPSQLSVASNATISPAALQAAIEQIQAVMPSLSVQEIHAALVACSYNPEVAASYLLATHPMPTSEKAFTLSASSADPWRTSAVSGPGSKGASLQYPSKGAVAPSTYTPPPAAGGYGYPPYSAAQNSLPSLSASRTTPTTRRSEERREGKE
eukprot:RCo030199